MPTWHFIVALLLSAMGGGWKVTFSLPGVVKPGSIATEEARLMQKVRMKGELRENLLFVKILIFLQKSTCICLEKCYNRIMSGGWDKPSVMIAET